MEGIRKEIDLKKNSIKISLPNPNLFIPFLNERGPTGEQAYKNPRKRLPPYYNKKTSFHQTYLKSQKLMYTKIPKNLRQKKKVDELRDARMIGKKIEFDSIGGQNVSEMHAGTKSLPSLIQHENLKIEKEKGDEVNYRDEQWIEDFNERLIHLRSKYSNLYINQIKRTKTKSIGLKLYNNIHQNKRERKEEIFRLKKRKSGNDDIMKETLSLGNIFEKKLKKKRRTIRNFFCYSLNEVDYGKKEKEKRKE